MERNPSNFLGWRMVAMAFVAQNVAIGTTFGSYGVFVQPLSSEFEASRFSTSLGIALLTLMMGLASPVIGRHIARHSIRRAMSLGAIGLGVSFLLASAAPNLWVFLGVVGLGCGVSTALLGPLPASTLVANWFMTNPGKPMGIALIPFGPFLAPVVAAWLITTIGWRLAFCTLGVLCLCLVPILRFVVDRPELDKASASKEGETQREASAHHHSSLGALIRSPRFWIIALSTGAMASGGIVIVTHLVPYATDLGVSYQNASFLLSVSGGSAMFGALLFGYLADRIGPRAALITNAVAQAFLWELLQFDPPYIALLAVAIGVGTCGGGVYVALSALMPAEFGRENVGASLGLSALVTLPFTFSSAPFAGYLFDLSASYHLPFRVYSIIFAIAAITLLLIGRGLPVLGRGLPERSA